MDIGEEIAKHLDWIEIVSGLIGEEDLSPEKRDEISRFDRCALGAWLDSAEAQQFEASGALAQVRQRHEEFHRLAGQLLDAISKGKAPQAVSLQEAFLEASRSLVEGLNALRESEPSSKR